MKKFLINLINYISLLSFTDILFFTVLMILIIVLIYLFRNNQYLDVIKKQVLINNENERASEKEDNIDLVTLAKNLEEVETKERTIELTPYEEEQEEKAIISYDELVKAKNDLMINYEDEKDDDGVVIKKVDLENLTKTVKNEEKEKNDSTPQVTISYAKEEAFLEALKQLQQMLNS